MSENLDIDREAQNHAQNNREQTPLDLETFDEMVKYLRGVENCRVNGQGWHVMDLNVFLNKVVPMVDQVPEEFRKTNVNCVTVKRTMKKVVEAHFNGSIERAGAFDYTKAQKWFEKKT